MKSKSKSVLRMTVFPFVLVSVLCGAHEGETLHRNEARPRSSDVIYLDCCLETVQQHGPAGFCLS